MAEIYHKVYTGGIKNTLVLDSRQALLYPMVFDDWNQIVVGAFFSFTDNSELNHSWGSSEVTYQNTFSTTRDMFYFGLKNNSSQFPKVSGSKFLGALTVAGARWWSDGDGLPTHFDITEDALTDVSYGSINDTSILTSTEAEIWTQSQSENAERFSLTSSFALMIALRFTVNDKGLATQTVSIDRYATTNNTDTSINALKELIQGSGYTSVATATFNSGDAALTLPNSLFIHFPWSLVRGRLHSVAAMKVE